MPEPDRQRWRDPRSYKTAWAHRAGLAAALVPDGARVLEVGVGTGAFKDLVRARTDYVGVDLEPFDAETTPLDLDRHPLPDTRFDYAVALGVFAYLHRPEVGAEKLCRAADHVIASYCCRRTDVDQPSALDARVARGWVNHFDRREFVALFGRQGHALLATTALNSTTDFSQYIMHFARHERQHGATPT